MPLRSAPSRLLRAMLLSPSPVRVEVAVRDLLLSRIDLPMRMLSVLLATDVGLRVADFCGSEIDGVLLTVDVAMREVRPLEIPVLDIVSEPATGCLVSVVVMDLCVPIEPPRLDLNLAILELERLDEPTVDCLAVVVVDGLSIRIELLVPDCEPGAGLSIRIELPMREVLPELNW